LLLAGCGGDADRGEAAATRAARAVRQARVERYLGVAFGNRFGPPPQRLRRWQGTVVLRPTGEVRYEDRFRLRLLVAQLAPVMHAAHLDLAEWDERPASLEIRYQPLESFPSPSPPPSPGRAAAPALSRLRVTADADGRLRSALLLLPSDEAVPQYMRDSLLVEGLAACLGLAGGVDEPWDSAFYRRANWDAWSFLDADLDLVELHYGDRVAPGLTRRQAATLLGADRDPPLPG
jgi:hypothetical protein